MSRPLKLRFIEVQHLYRAGFKALVEQYAWKKCRCTWETNVKSYICTCKKVLYRVCINNRSVSTSLVNGWLEIIKQWLIRIRCNIRIFCKETENAILKKKHYEKPHYSFRRRDASLSLSVIALSTSKVLWVTIITPWRHRWNRCRVLIRVNCYSFY